MSRGRRRGCRGAVIADASTAGRSCPYCRFPIKEGTEVNVCPTCGSAHHAECWSDNRGCAILGCASGPAEGSETPTGPRAPARTTTPQSAPGPVAPRTPRAAPAAAAYAPPGYPPAGPPRNNARNALIVAAVVAVLVLGAALAFVIGKSSGRGATTEVVRTESANNGAGHTNTATTNTEASTTASTHTTAPATPSLTSYTGSNFTMLTPAGWTQDADEKQLENETESKWSNPGNSSEYILLDVHAPVHKSMQEGAEPVRDQLVKQPGYTQIYYGPGNLSQHPGSWMWIFEIEGAERIDYFFETCSNTIGDIGSAPPSRFGELRGMYREIANSFKSECE